MNETAERLMDLRGSHREAGYRASAPRSCSEIGIKSASVHHHFPTKAGMPLRSRADTGIASSNWSRGGVMRAATR